MIGVINYGAGNVGSVLRAVQFLGRPAEAVDDADRLQLIAPFVPGEPEALELTTRTGCSRRSVSFCPARDISAP